MAMVDLDVDGSSQFSADSQSKSTGLVWGLAATRRSVHIHQLNWVNSHNDFGRDASTIKFSWLLIVIILLLWPVYHLCVRSHMSKTAYLNLSKFSARITGGRGSVILWQQRNSLCTSGFVDAVLFFLKIVPDKYRHLHQHWSYNSG